MVTLRRLENADEAVIFDWISDPELRKMTGTRGIPDQNSHRKWFNTKLNDKDNYTLIIQVDGVPVGLIGTNEINHLDQNANIYLYLGDSKFRNRGIGTVALQMFSELLLSECKCHKIIAFIRSYNTPSIRLFMKNGFICEGVQKEQVCYNGMFYDRLLFGKIFNPQNKTMDIRS